MVNTLLAHWNEPPRLEVRLHDSFPLAEATGVPQAFGAEEPNWDMLRGRYGPGVYINPGTPLEWREVSLATARSLEDCLRAEGGVVSFDGFKIDSFTIQAQRKPPAGNFNNFSYLETGIYCFMLSPDEENIIVGTRGGSESIGQVIAAPVGSVGYPKGNLWIDPITDAVLAEAHEELGLLPGSYTAQFVGLFRQEPGSAAPSNNFFYVAQLKIPPEWVVRCHTQAMELYRNFKREAKGTDQEKEFAARGLLAQMAEGDLTIPRDAWENEHLRLLPNNPEQLISALRPSMERNELKHGMYGALALYFLHAFGKQWYGKLLDVPKVKGEIKEGPLLQRII